jgi:hypothetical protein
MFVRIPNSWLTNQDVEKKYLKNKQKQDKHKFQEKGNPKATSNEDTLLLLLLS